MRSWWGGLALATVLIGRGAGDSLRLTQERLGADIVVVPEGSEQKVEGALLMGSPIKVWMPYGNVQKIAAVPGVQAASPQLYLESLSNASCCSVSNMFMVAYDPNTDFTIQPLARAEDRRRSQAGPVRGRYVRVRTRGEQNITLYGYILTLKANLRADRDQSRFVYVLHLRDGI